MKFLTLFSLLVSFTFLVQSCQKNVNYSELTPKAQTSDDVLNKEQLQPEISNFLTNYELLHKLSVEINGISSVELAPDFVVNLKEMFDARKAKIVAFEFSSIQSIVVRANDFNESSAINYALSFSIKSDELVFPCLMKLVRKNNGEKEITYFSLDSNIALSLKQHGDRLSLKKFSYSNAVITDRLCTGAQVLDCVEEAYTEEGWASLGLWVVTAFYPETAVAAGLVCAISCE